MTKKEYLEELAQALKALPVSDIEEIVYDYSEHIQVAVERGEIESEVIKRLGSPKAIAKEYTLNHFIKTAKSKPSGANYTKVLLAALGLGFFNLVIVLGPFIGIWGVLIGFFISGAALVLSGVVALMAILLIPTGLATGLSGTIWDVTALIGIGATLGSIGLLIMLGTSLLSKKFYHMTLKYLQLNMQLLTGK